MSNSNSALANITSKELAEGTTFSARQVDLIRDQIMPGASNDELMLFVQVASSRGLDPFRKHIYAVSRRSKVDDKWVDKWSYQVSIDGLRLVAQRSGHYEGQTPPQWCGSDAVWKDVWISDEPPAAARVGVYIKDAREPVYAVALYRTFCQRTKEGNPTKFWKDMPEHMLAKCAESQALRKACPEEAGGLYTTEEMGQSGTPRPIEASGYVVDSSTGEIDVNYETERKRRAHELWVLAHDTYGWNKDELNVIAVDVAGADLVDLSADRLAKLYQTLVVMSPEERDAVLTVARAA